jgi:hypothetical protein
MDVHRSFAQLAVVEGGVCRDEGRIGVKPEELRAGAATLEELLTVFPPERQEPLRRQLFLLDEACEQLDLADLDRRVMVVADPSGIGSGRDVLMANLRGRPDQQ